MNEKDLKRQQDAITMVGAIFGFTESELDWTPAWVIVGWYQEDPDTVKGRRHVCLRCQPTKPFSGPWKAVQATQLAARMPCTQCGTNLEDTVV